MTFQKPHDLLIGVLVPGLPSAPSAICSSSWFFFTLKSTESGLAQSSLGYMRGVWGDVQEEKGKVEKSG
jgi:hypothetical protein